MTTDDLITLILQSSSFDVLKMRVRQLRLEENAERKRVEQFQREHEHDHEDWPT